MKKGSKPGLAFLWMLLAGVLGGAAGFWLMHMAQPVGIWDYLGQLILLVVVYYGQIVLHEAGHLLGGLLSGYRFLSFRVGRVMVLRQGGRWVLRSFHIPGTGGQCLMLPPEGDDVPTRLYNLGGGLLNLASVLLVLPLLAHPAPLLRAFAGMVILVGLLLAVTNLVPMHLNGMPNDGIHAQLLPKDPQARQAFLLQLRINGALTQGLSLRELPDSWFPRPSDAPPTGPLAAGNALISAMRLLDQGEISRAYEAMELLQAQAHTLIPIQRMELVCELQFCGLLLGRPRPDSWDTPELSKYRRSTRAVFPSRSRQDYALALLEAGDEGAAQQALAQFERVSARYPYSGEVAGERRLLELVRRQWMERLSTPD